MQNWKQFYVISLSYSNTTPKIQNKWGRTYLGYPFSLNTLLLHAKLWLSTGSLPKQPRSAVHFNRMSTITFGTYAFAKRLKAAGFNEVQAEALTSAQKESIDNALVTKDDIRSELEPIKLEIADLKGEMKLIKWMLGFLVAGVATIILKLFVA